MIEKSDDQVTPHDRVAALEPPQEPIRLVLKSRPGFGWDHCAAGASLPPRPVPVPLAPAEVEEILVSDLVTEPHLGWYLGPWVAAETDGSILVAWMRYIESDPQPERPITILVSECDPTSGSWSEPEAVTTLSVYWAGYPSPYGGLALVAGGGEAMIAYTSFNEPDEFDIRATRRW